MNDLPPPSPGAPHVGRSTRMNGWAIYGYGRPTEFYWLDSALWAFHHALTEQTPLARALRAGA